MDARLPALDLDPYAPDVLLNPQPYYRRLRELGPVVRIPRYGACASGRIDTVERVFRDPDTFCSARGVGIGDFATEPPWRPPSIILEVDPPAHARTRSVMARAMSPRAAQALQTRFDDNAIGLVSAALARDTLDGVSDLAEVYPLGVFADAVGLDVGDRSPLLRYGRMVFDALGPDNAIRRASMADAAEVVPWIEAKCAREALGSDGFGAAIYTAADAGEITVAEAGLLVRSLLSAGIDTTVAAIANLLFCFASAPGQWEALRADRARIPAAIDEALRFEPPIHTFCRTSTCATELDGAPIAAGTKVLCVMGAANRDPARWERPDEFDIARPPRPHVAFGSGIHVCVGQHVARRELTALLAALCDAVAGIEFAGEPVWRAGNAVHTLARLPLRLRAA